MKGHVAYMYICYFTRQKSKIQNLFAFPEIDTCVRRRDGARSEKALNKRNDVLIGSFTVTCTPIVRR